MECSIIKRLFKSKFKAKSQKIETKIQFQVQISNLCSHAFVCDRECDLFEGNTLVFGASMGTSIKNISNTQRPPTV